MDAKTKVISLSCCILLHLQVWGQQSFELIEAIQANELPQVKALVTAGADVNVWDENRATALMWAAYKGDLEMLQYLVAQGADFTQKGVIYLNEEKTAYYGNLMGIAGGEGKLELLKYLIEELNIDVDDKEYNPKENAETGWTATQWAINEKYEEIAIFLIEKGADYRLSFNNNWTFLHYAARNNLVALTRLLLTKNVELNVQTTQGWSPLMLAAYNYNWKIYHMLIDAGANKEMVGEDGTTVLDWAIEQKRLPGWKILHEAGRQAYEEGNYQKSQNYWEKAKIQAIREFGKDHLYYGMSLNNLANLYQCIGRYREAEPLYKEAIKNTESILGKHHPSYGIRLNNLAGLYKALGRYKEAETLYQEALLNIKSTLGKDHFEYSKYLGNLAGLYKSMGRYKEAETLYQEALLNAKLTLDKDHPDYGTLLNNLAELYLSLGRYSEAEPLYKEALQNAELALGKDHPVYGIRLNNLAGLYLSISRYTEAEFMIEEALNIFQQTLGKKHPHYASCLHNQAILYYKNGLYSEAASLFQQTLALKKATFGIQHPDYALTLSRLAELYMATQLNDSAMIVLQQSNLILEMVVGQQHPEYLKNLHQQASVYEQQSAFHKANEVYQKITQLSLKTTQANSNEILRNLTASASEGMIVAESSPFLAIYAPEPTGQDHRGVSRIPTENFIIKGFTYASNGIVELFINNNSVKVSNRGLWQHSVQLLEGENQFVIHAISQSGDVTIDTVKLTYQNQTINASYISRTFLLVIAIDKYYYEDWPSLNMPVKDARDLVHILQTRYTFTEVDTLFNEAASRENVRQSLKKLIGTTTPNDQVLVYFAGHGELDQSFDEEGYWILSDGRLSNKSKSVVINKIPAKHVLILADACFSGSLYLQRGKEEERKQEHKSRWVIASGRLERVADQMPDHNNSPFAHFILEYLNESNDHVYADELAESVVQKVAKVTQQEPIAGPVEGDKGGLFIFRLKNEEQ